MMMNKRGQGLTEYGIILLLVLMIGGVVWFHYDVRSQLGTIYSTISSDLKSIAGDDQSQEENYDTGETKTIDTTLLHETSLSLKGKTIWWYVTSKGVKQYTIKDLDNSILKINRVGNGNFGTGNYHYTDEANTYGAVFFQADDGYTYEMKSYGNETNNITKVTGNLPYTDSKYHIVSDEVGQAKGYVKVTVYK